MLSKHPFSGVSRVFLKSLDLLIGLVYVAFPMPINDCAYEASNLLFGFGVMVARNYKLYVKKKHAAGSASLLNDYSQLLLLDFFFFFYQKAII